MNAAFALLNEVDQAVEQGSGARRAEIARGLTDLLLANTERYSTAEITLIDDVFVRLVGAIEESSRVLLATRLAPLSKAPPRILRALAQDDAIAVASPILVQSEALDDDALIKCAGTKSQDHLLAISRRKSLAQSVTDILVERGDERVVLSTAQNSGATFSDNGFAALVDRSQADARLAVCVGSRPDIPARLLRQLLDSASDIVRDKLAAERPHLRHEIDRIVAGVAAKIETHATVLSPKYAAAQALVESLNQAGKLSAAKIEAFVTALMSRLPIDVVEHKLNADFVPFLLVLAKGTGLSWITVRVVLLMLGIRHHRCSDADIDKALVDFQQLSRAAALNILNVCRDTETSASLH
jgi:uncharacterized protein (DUF2336 family)